MIEETERKALLWIGRQLDEGKEVSATELHNRYPDLQPLQVQMFFINTCSIYLDCYSDEYGCTLVPHKECIGTFLNVAEKEVRKRKIEESITKQTLAKFKWDIGAVVISAISLALSIFVICKQYVP